MLLAVQNDTFFVGATGTVSDFTLDSNMLGMIAKSLAQPVEHKALRDGCEEYKMPRNGLFFPNRYLPPKNWRGYLTMLCVAIQSVLVAGCGGGEDFSKPPAEIQSQLGKAATDPPEAATDLSRLLTKQRPRR